ncbi:hypothetical protein CCH79_00020626, partial [Gambusia affinis]
LKKHPEVVLILLILLQPNPDLQSSVSVFQPLGFSVTMATTSPKDKYLAVWVIFFMLGLGTLLPWNFFMTATVYFRNRLKEPLPTEVSANQSEAAGQHQSVLETKFNNVMTLCAMLPLLLCTCLTSFLHSLKITNDYRLVAMTTPIMEVLKRRLLAHLRKQSAYRHGDAIIHLLHQSRCHLDGAAALRIRCSFSLTWL